MKQTIIYIRTSTEEQNPQNQLNDCREVIKKLGIKNYEVIEDKQSAWKDKDRIGFEKVKSLIKQKQVNHLICFDVDRLYRNRKRFKEFLEFIKLYNVQLHSFRQEWLDELHSIPPPWNDIVMDLMINIYGHISEEESNKKSDRVKLAVRKQEGKPTTSYKGNKWGRKSMIESVDDEIIELRNKGMSIREIANSVFYWDKNNNKHKISIGYVHKTLKKK